MPRKYFKTLKKVLKKVLNTASGSTLLFKRRAKGIVRGNNHSQLARKNLKRRS